MIIGAETRFHIPRRRGLARCLMETGGAKDEPIEDHGENCIHERYQQNWQAEFAGEEMFGKDERAREEVTEIPE